MILNRRNHHFGIANALFRQILANFIRDLLKIAPGCQGPRQHHEDGQEFVEVMIVEELRDPRFIARWQVDVVAFGKRQQGGRANSAFQVKVQFDLRHAGDELIDLRE